MDKLVGELLTLSRLEAGMASRQQESVNVADLVTEVAVGATFELNARSTPVALDCRVAPHCHHGQRRDVASCFRGEAAWGTSGHGLGLAIARRAIESHGGGISASNRTSGGLAVEIRLPA